MKSFEVVSFLRNVHVPGEAGDEIVHCRCNRRHC